MNMVQQSLYQQNDNNPVLVIENWNSSHRSDDMRTEFVATKYNILFEQK